MQCLDLWKKIPKKLKEKCLNFKILFLIILEYLLNNSCAYEYNGKSP